MRTHWLPALAALAFSTVTIAAPTEADIDAVRNYVEVNKPYSPPARAEALRLLQTLPSLQKEPAKFELTVARIVALADNGHSAMFPSQWASRYARSPVRFGLFADGLYIIEAPSQHAPLIGRKVATINGRPWRDIRTAFAAYQGGTDELRDQHFTIFMETPALLAAAGLGPAESLTIAMEGVSGAVTVLPVLKPTNPHAMHQMVALRSAAPLIRAAKPVYLRNDEAFDMVDMPQLGAVYLRMDQVRGDGLGPFMSQALARLNQDPPKHVILDLRFNMGGDLNLARDFARSLPAAVPGQLYAITSGQTFSAAISTLGYLKQAAGDRLTIVGEPIGDRLEFWAEGDIVKLPGLGAMLLTATERHNYQTGCPEADCHKPIRDNPIKVDSLEPNIRTPLSFANYVAGSDPALDAIANDIRRHAKR